jgi:N-sulfoglucosamine sulfohydrolase
MGRYALSNSRRFRYAWVPDDKSLPLKLRGPRMHTSMFFPCSKLILAVVLLGRLWAGDGHAAASEPKKVNIVVFMADDHGYLDSTVYGSKQVRTPNMARIARAGATFTHMFVASPSCAPSRAALLTGRMPARNGAEANHAAPHASIVTLPIYLRRLGYTVAAFGKVAHYKMADRFGFDHIDPKHATEAVRNFLKTHDPAKPLCLLVGTHNPHVPWPEPKDYDPAKLKPPPDCVDTPATRAYLARYYTAVTQMDQELGEIYDLVRAHFHDDVLFLYLSDHGAQWPFGKWNLYDAGIRVPLLAVWPGRIAPGSRVDAMISSVDVLPTFVELAGGPVLQGLDGRSFAKVLRGEAKEHRSEIYATHTNDGRFNVYPIRCLRTRGFAYILNLHPDWAHTTHIDLAQPKDGLSYWLSWKAAAQKDPAAAALVKRYHERPREELYDVASDPWQLKNLASDPANAERLKSMRAQLADWMKAQGDEGRVLVAPRPLRDPESWRNPLELESKSK